MSSFETTNSDSRIPLFVDLDGTLIASDMFQEALLLAIKENPFVVFRFPGLLLKGLAAFKHEIAKTITPDARLLPINTGVVDELRLQKATGRPVFLATASDQKWAAAFANEYPLFDEVMASDGVTNLKSKNKLAGIRKVCEERGWSQFEYWGDSSADLSIWSADESASIFAVDPSLTVKNEIAKIKKPVRIIDSGKSKLRAIAKVIRPQQWVKNLLLFIPLLMAHKWGELSSVLHVVVGFVSFSLCASAIYVFNDLLDAQSDRQHHRKKKRPFASGNLRLSMGPVLIIGLLIASFVVALVGLPWETKTAQKFVLMLAAYGVANLLYTVWLKRRMVIDVIMLAGMYTLRILIGGIAANVFVSEWLLAFSIFFFTSLAFAKRYAELSKLASEEEFTSSAGRGYSIKDLGIIESIGPTSGYISVLVLALYINQSPYVNQSPNMKLYKNSFMLWLICPIVMYWITRLWFIAKRNELIDDPIVFAIRDKISWLTLAIILCLAVSATLFDISEILKFIGL